MAHARRRGHMSTYHRSFRFQQHLFERITAEEILRCCRDKLAGYKRPKEVVFISPEEMPRTPTGKILHRILKEKLRTPKR